MAAKAKALGYSLGYLHARLAVENEEEGHVQLVAGRAHRCKVEQVDEYHNEEQGTLLLWLAGREEPRHVMGTVEEMDEIVKRHHTWVVQTSS